MRLAGWLRLVALCVIAGNFSLPAASARAASSDPKKPLVKEEFKGYGLTQKLAETNALERACSWLTDNSKFGWIPSPEYLREKNLVKFDEPTEEEFEKAGDFAKDRRMKVVKMHLEISADQARDIQKQARQERMGSRHLLLARILGGLVCLLIVVGGYLRLEEATKGYYTRLLRLAGIGILVSIALALSLVR
jgi:hypothetical protein